jgi:hypothetical protein
MSRIKSLIDAVDEPMRYERVGEVIGTLRNRIMRQLHEDLEHLADLMLDYDDSFIAFFEILLYSGLDERKRLERREMIRFCSQICSHLDIRVTGNDYNIDNLVKFVDEVLLDDVDFIFDIANNDFYEIRLSDAYHNEDTVLLLVEAVKYNANLLLDKKKQ